MQTTERLEQLKTEERAKPLAFVMHDTAMIRSDRAYNLITTGGWEYLGLYIAVRDIIAARENHCYPIHDGGARLGWELHNLPQAALRAFLETLKDAGLADAESFEGGMLRLREVDAAAEHRAEQSAARRLAAETTNAKRNAKRDGDRVA